MRRTIVFAWLALLLSGVITLFWYYEWMYQLPTAVPEGYQFVRTQEVLDIPAVSDKIADKPVLLHFFNPDCPCSRFNIPHFRSLLKRYKGQVDFIVVMMSDKAYTERDIRNRIGEEITVVMDQNIARFCGVYSTPQAVILDKESRINYRGNYNKNRYCSNTKTEYARIALDSLLTEKARPVFGPMALKAYGCQITVCKSK